MENHSYLSQLKLLYVEDNKDTREGLLNFLKRRLGKVMTASDGREGLKKYYDEKPQIVITDILMPEMNGLEMLSKIRAKDSSCAFIITSTVDESNTILKAIDYGIIKYVVKPIVLSDLDDILNKVAEELRGSSADIIENDIDEKHRIENILKKELSLSIKGKAGKGPRDLTVFIHDSHIDVVTYDATNAMENIILDGGRNKGLVEQLRRVFYFEIGNDLEAVIYERSGIKVKLGVVDFNPLNRSDKLVFDIDIK